MKDNFCLKEGSYVHGFANPYDGRQADESQIRQMETFYEQQDIAADVFPRYSILHHLLLSPNAWLVSGVYQVQLL
ncbi:hypothetical protein D3C75_1279660 [compost metagenome]